MILGSLFWWQEVLVFNEFFIIFLRCVLGMEAVVYSLPLLVATFYLEAIRFPATTLHVQTKGLFKHSFCFVTKLILCLIKQQLSQFLHTNLILARTLVISNLLESVYFNCCYSLKDIFQQ